MAVGELTILIAAEGRRSPTLPVIQFVCKGFPSLTTILELNFEWSKSATVLRVPSPIGAYLRMEMLSLIGYKPV